MTVCSRDKAWVFSPDSPDPPDLSFSSLGGLTSGRSPTHTDNTSLRCGALAKYLPASRKMNSTSS